MVQKSFAIIVIAAVVLAGGCGDQREKAGVRPSIAEGGVIWSVNVGEVDWCSPAIGADGTIYQGDLYGNMFAINPDGSVKWRKVFGGCDLAESSPTLTADGKRMYFGTHNSPGEVYCVNPSNGEVMWTYTIPRGGGGIVSSAAIGADGTIYIGTGDWFEGNVGDIGDDRFFAINPDGTLKWIFRDEEETGTERTAFFANAAIGANGTIYIGSFKGYFYALRDEGNRVRVKWKFATKNRKGEFEEIWSSAAIDADGAVYFGSNSGKVYALRDLGKTYELKWQFRTYGEVWASPVIGADGTLRWKTRVLGQDETRTSPNIGVDGTVYVCGGVSGVLYAIKGAGPLAETAWPKMQRDLKNTGW